MAHTAIQPVDEFTPAFPTMRELSDVFPKVHPYTRTQAGFYAMPERIVGSLYVTCDMVEGYKSMRADLAPEVKEWIEKHMLHEQTIYVKIVQFPREPESCGVYIQYDQIIGSRRIAHVTTESVQRLLASVGQ